MREVLKGELKPAKRDGGIQKSRKERRDSGLELLMIKVKKKLDTLVRC